MNGCDIRIPEGVRIRIRLFGHYGLLGFGPKSARAVLVRFSTRSGEATIAETVASILKKKGDAIWSVEPTATVYEAIAMMAEKSVGALLVVSDGKLVGMISERDYARKVVLQRRSSSDTLVHEIMTGSVITVTPDHSVENCMKIITEHRVRHLPVLVGDKLLGVISIGDLVNAIITEQAETIGHLSTYISGR
jgi:CBS domain-containing protein